MGCKKFILFGFIWGVISSTWLFTSAFILGFGEHGGKDLLSSSAEKILFLPAYLSILILKSNALRSFSSSTIFIIGIIIPIISGIALGIIIHGVKRR